MKHFKIFLLLGLLGCSSPSSLLKKAERLTQRAIEKGAQVSADTVYVDKVVITEKHVLDSNVWFRNLTDTITVEKEKVVTKVRINTIKRTVYIHTECKPDTLIVRVPVEIVKEIKAGASWWDVVKICIIVAGISILLTILFYNRRN